MGTPALCAIIAVYGLMHLDEVSGGWLLAGAVCYLIGPFGITARCNVPLNDKLEAVQDEEGEAFWREYQVKWQRWNHLRTIIGLVSIIFLCLALAGSQS